MDKKKIYIYDKEKIYIYDTDVQVNYQLNLNDAFSDPIVQMLTWLLNQHNHYTVNCVPNLGQLQMQNTQYYEIHIQPFLHNDRHYNLPTGWELAASSLKNETTSEYCDISAVGIAFNYS